MKIRVAINGFGRIGRAFFRAAHGNEGIDIVAINDIGQIENLAYLLSYDSVYGRAPFPVSVEGSELIAGGERCKVLSETDPSKLPWKELNIDVVIESTGLYAGFDKSKVHLDAGAKRVVITAPAKDAPEGVPGATVLVGINDALLKDCLISSNASCTTNAASPVMQILHEALGIEKALLSTTHAYTASQNIVDGPVKKAKGKADFRDGRAGAHNIVPSSTGAAVAVTKAIPDLAGKFDGISLRVPVVAGSIADMTCIVKRDTTAEEVNDILKRAAKDERWSAVFTVTEEPIVSTDILGAKHASIADLSLTRVAGGNLVKVLAWYDNEMGYANSLIEHVVRAGKYLA